MMNEDQGEPPKRVLFNRPRRWLASALSYLRTTTSPDRRLLVRELLPAFAGLGGEILWVGVRRYTRAYPARLERRGAICWTTDIDPRWSRFGRRGRHLVGDVLRVDEAFPPGQFRAVLCNGVFGWGVDDPAAQGAALAAMARVLEPGGWLLLGWNTDRTDDPLEHPDLARWFEPAALGALPARRPVPGTTHVYDLLRRTR